MESKLFIVTNMKKLLFLLSLIFFSHTSIFGQKILFMAGIEKDLSSDRQAQILRKYLPKSTVVTYKKDEVTKIIRDSKIDTNVTIVLFSAACKSAYEIIISTYCDVWVVEPHFAYGKGIRDAVNIGFPKNQIILGPTPERGQGILEKGQKNTPESLNHFNSLKYLSLFLSK